LTGNNMSLLDLNPWLAQTSLSNFGTMVVSIEMEQIEIDLNHLIWLKLLFTVQI